MHCGSTVVTRDAWIGGRSRVLVLRIPNLNPSNARILRCRWRRLVGNQKRHTSVAFHVYYHDHRHRISSMMTAEHVWMVKTHLTCGERPLSSLYSVWCRRRPAKSNSTSPHQCCASHPECTLSHSSWREVCYSRQSKVEKKTPH